MILQEEFDGAATRDITPEEGVSIMFDAVNLDDMETARQLIAAGVPVDVRNEYGDTPLIMAVHRGHYDMAQEFLNLKADPNARNQDGLNPLHYAIRQNANMMKLLLDNGAENPKGSASDLAARLLDGIMAGYDNVVEAALAGGAKPNGIIPNNDGATFLHIAGQNAKPRMVAALVAAGANINATDNNQRSVLRAALEGKDLDCVMTLLNAGADTQNRSLDRMSSRNVKDSSFAVSCDFDIATAVVEAAKKFEMIENAAEGKIDDVRVALEEGIQANTFDRLGRTALFWACENGHAAVTKLLIDFGADVHLRMKNGDPVMFAAVVNNKPDCIRVLGEAHASVLERDSSGKSPAEFVDMDPDITGVTPQTRAVVNHFKALEVDSLSVKATCLDSAVSPMKKLRFQPRLMGA